MNIKEIENALTFPGKHYPELAVKEAIAHQEEITPILLKSLDYAQSQGENLKPDYMLHRFAVYLLGHFREQKAFPKLIQAFKLEGWSLQYLFGDVLLNKMDEVVCSTFNGDLDLLRELFENEQTDGVVREVSLIAYGKLARKGIVSQDEVVFRVRNYLSSSDCWTVQLGVNATADLRLEELIPDVKDAYARGDNKKIFMEYDFFLEEVSSDLQEDVYFNGEPKEMKKLSWLFKNDSMPIFSAPKSVSKTVKSVTKTIPITVVKIGRNDPCPCGSGKKYKKCCS